MKTHVNILISVWSSFWEWKKSITQTDKTRDKSSIQVHCRPFRLIFDRILKWIFFFFLHFLWFWVGDGELISVSFSKSNQNSTMKNGSKYMWQYKDIWVALWPVPSPFSHLGKLDICLCHSFQIRRKQEPSKILHLSVICSQCRSPSPLFQSIFHIWSLPSN